MVELSIMSSAWQNFIHYVNDEFNSKLKLATAQAITLEHLAEYHGIVTDTSSWRVYFKTEQDLSFFVLKWS